MKLVEGQFGHGAIQLNKFHRKVRKIFRPRITAGIGFDWDKGYDVRDVMGQITIKNQGQNYSCGGQAGAYFIEIQRKLQSIKEGECSAKSIYSPIAAFGGGTSIDLLEKQIGGAGANLESAVPSYDAYHNPLSEAMMIEKSWITSDLSIEALNRAGYTPYDIADDIDSVAEAIQNYGAVIWEITGKNNGTWLSSYPKPPLKTDKSPLWAHFMCVIGAKMIDGKKTIIALQSWGGGVGDNGVQYFQEDYFNSGYIVDAFTFIYDRYIAPNPSNTSFWAKVARWFRSSWGLK